jgi:hypothetical protein
MMEDVNDDRVYNKKGRGSDYQEGIRGMASGLGQRWYWHDCAFFRHTEQVKTKGRQKEIFQMNASLPGEGTARYLFLSVCQAYVG